MFISGWWLSTQVCCLLVKCYFSIFQKSHWCGIPPPHPRSCFLLPLKAELIEMSSLWIGNVLFHVKADSRWASPMTQLTISQLWAVSYMPYTWEHFGPEDKDSLRLFGDSHHLASLRCCFQSNDLSEVLAYWGNAVLCLVCRLCLTLCLPVALQAPLSMGILQARKLEWVAMPSSRASSQPRIEPKWVGPKTVLSYRMLWQLASYKE